MPRHYWKVLLAYIITLFSVIIGAPLIFRLIPSLTENQAITYWNILSFVVGLFVILYLMRSDIRESLNHNDSHIWVKRNPNRQSKTFLKRKPSGIGEIILWSITGYFMAYIAIFITSAIEFSLGISQGSENTQMIMNTARETPLFMIFPMIIAPILEEIVFRKILFGTIYRYSNFIVAGLVSAFIFGLVHQEFIHILNYSAMGFVFAFLYIRTKRIIVPIIVHMALNSTTIIIQYNLTPEDIEKMQKQLEQLQMIFVGG